ncbi:MAG: Phosphoenolpyruvate carboxykinase (GTP) [bacterium ADurb.Bin236]|nr:MAG: Phosphoenolpyruvate carboxykinase (GTP) [bacterium ADurb.Bin236]HPN94228.1 phosphoenolpyruvate carboxykinase (GTP) [bacterium]
MVKSEHTNHRELIEWVNKMAAMCKPDDIVWIDGSDEQKKQLEEEAIKTGEVLKLDQKKLPGCLYHRTAENDTARTEHLTYICTTKKDDAGPNNNWMDPKEAYSTASKYFSGSMRGRTMYVIPFSMGPVSSPFSKIGIELTDSIYVVLNMIIMTRVGTRVLDALGTDGAFTKCLHGKAELDIDKRLILHFPEDNAIWSVNSGYGGNVLLGKKCLSLRIASYLAAQESWLAEHMLILGVEDPEGRIIYVAGAFPSACGKTNLAMLIPPKALKKKGYRVWTVGDDIAWMRIDTDGQLWAVNPETGMFGVAPGTNSKSNPNAMATVSKNTIFTNVLLKKDGTVWWEGHDDPPPAEGGINWQGLKWKPGMKNEKGEAILGAHANSRFTAPLSQCPSITNRIEHHHGVPISAILFGGRRARVAPLVYEAFTWQHGVYMGATMASERTAAQFGLQGEVRRDPMAMLPFCGYNMADYFRHWLNMGNRMLRTPRIFHVNWFRTDDNGKFIWPGFGDNLRVLAWIAERCRGVREAAETPIGYMPHPGDIDMTGLNLSPAELKGLLEIDKEEWKREVKDIDKFFDTFGDAIPKRILAEHDALRRRLRKI